MSLTDQSFSQRAPASGTVSVKIRPRSRLPWTMQQITADVGNFNSAIAVLIRKNGRVVTPLVLDPQTGTGVASGLPYVKLLPNDIMTVDFTGMTSGDIAHVLAIYDDGSDQ